MQVIQPGYARRFADIRPGAIFAAVAVKADGQRYFLRTFTMRDSKREDSAIVLGPLKTGEALRLLPELVFANSAVIEIHGARFVLQGDPDFEPSTDWPGRVVIGGKDAFLCAKAKGKEIDYDVTADIRTGEIKSPVAPLIGITKWSIVIGEKEPLAWFPPDQKT